jgi:hypothetical protein
VQEHHAAQMLLGHLALLGYEPLFSFRLVDGAIITGGTDIVYLIWVVSHI